MVVRRKKKKKNKKTKRIRASVRRLAWQQSGPTVTSRYVVVTADDRSFLDQDLACVCDSA